MRVNIQRGQVMIEGRPAGFVKSADEDGGLELRIAGKTYTCNPPDADGWTETDSDTPTPDTVPDTPTCRGCGRELRGKDLGGYAEGGSLCFDCWWDSDGMSGQGEVGR